MEDNVRGTDFTKTRSPGRSIQTSMYSPRRGSGGSGKIEAEVQCLVPLDALRLVPWIVVVSFLPTPLHTHPHKTEVS